MKRLSVILAISLIFNLLLAAAWWISPTLISPKSTSAVTETRDSHSQSAIAVARDAKAVLSPVIWQQLSADLTDGPESDAALVARLRQAGFSPDILRAVVRERIRQRYDQREADLIASQPPVAYWKLNPRERTGEFFEVRAELRHLEFEKERLFVALLGADADSPADIRARERRFGGIDRLKAAEADTILSDYRDLEMQVRTESPDVTSQERREKLALIAKERERDLATLFTPEENAAYQLREGETARWLQSQLREFGATRDEYESILVLQSAFDAQYGLLTSGLTREQRTARTAAMPQHNAEIAQALGTERYAEYEARTSNDYILMKQLTDLLELPSETALEAAPLPKLTKTASREIIGNKALTPEQRTEQLTTLRDNTREKLRGLLGTDGLSAYEGSFAGRWIENIVPSPRPIPQPTTGP